MRFSLRSATAVALRLASARVLTSIAAEKYKPDNVPSHQRIVPAEGSRRHRHRRIARPRSGDGGRSRRSRRVADALRAARRMADADGRRDARRAASRSKACSATSPKPADVQAVVDKTIAAFGRVDILVNNAGVTWAAEPEDMPLDKWQKVVDINLTGAFLFAQAAGREMLKRQSGRIINIASIAGMHASVQGPHYAAVRGDQGRPDRADARAGGVVGAQGHPRQRDCARLLPLAAGRRRDRDERGVDQGDAARSRASATPASSKASRCFWPPTPPTTSPARRSSSTEDAQSREHAITVRRAAVAAALRLLGPAAHDVSGPAARRHPRADGRRTGPTRRRRSFSARS